MRCVVVGLARVPFSRIRRNRSTRRCAVEIRGGFRASTAPYASNSLTWLHWSLVLRPPWVERVANRRRMDWAA